MGLDCYKSIIRDNGVGILSKRYRERVQALHVLE